MISLTIQRGRVRPVRYDKKQAPYDNEIKRAAWKVRSFFDGTKNDVRISHIWYNYHDLRKGTKYA
jgi:hypothetical protein